MKTYSLAFGAGETKVLDIQGKFLYLLETITPVSVQFQIQGVRNGELAEDVEAGFNVRPLKGFDKVEVSSAAAQTIKIAVTNGEGDYNRTISSVSGTVDIGNLPDEYIEYGAAFASNAAMAANTPLTVFTPAANLNGAILHAASFLSYSSAAVMYEALLAKASPPANNLDGDMILGANFLASIGSGIGCGNDLKIPVFIPAGKGLYFISNVAQTTLAQRRALYTLL